MLIALIPQTGFAEVCKETSEFEKIYLMMSAVKDSWAPSFSPESCELKDLSPACKTIFSGENFGDADWKQYAAICSTEKAKKNSDIEVIGGCLNLIKEIAVGIGESAAESALNRAKLKECNTSRAKKKELIDSYNSRMPAVLRFFRELNLANVSCEEIQSTLSRYHSQMKRKWLAKVPFYLEEKQMTKSEREFKYWLELRYARDVVQNMEPTILTVLLEDVRKMSCFNSYYKADMVCSTLFGLVGIAKPFQFSKSVLSFQKYVHDQNRIAQIGLTKTPHAGPSVAQRQKVLDTISRLEKEMLGSPR